MCWATQRRLQTVVSSSQSHTAIPGSFPRLFCKKFASFSSSRNLSRFVTTRGTCFLCGLLPRFRSCSRPIPFFFPLCHLEPFFNTCSPKLTRQNVPVIQCSRYGCGDPYTLLKKNIEMSSYYDLLPAIGSLHINPIIHSYGVPRSYHHSSDDSDSGGGEKTLSQTYDTPPNYDRYLAEDTPFIPRRSTSLTPTHVETSPSNRSFVAPEHPLVLSPVGPSHVT